VARLARRAQRAALQAPEAVFGLAWSGAMTQSRLTGLLRRLPEGRTEIYLHPATAGGFDGHAPGYRYVDELAALTAPSAIAAARAPGIVLGGYSEF
jgi:predicted ATPase